MNTDRKQNEDNSVNQERSKEWPHVDTSKNAKKWPHLSREKAAQPWLKLNAHGKWCLEKFICAISGTDIRTSQMDYLFDKDLVDYALNYKNADKRVLLAGHCLTDLGIETVMHYFPKYSSKLREAIGEHFKIQRP